MLEPRNIAEKKFNNETNRIIGEIQLQQYGLFFERYISLINSFKIKMDNKLHIRYEPISFEVTTHEDNSLLDLVHSDNKLLRRILISLTSVCNEINLLVQEVKNDFCPTFLFYGEEAKNKNECLQNISELTNKFEKVTFFLNRSHQVIILLMRQMCAILGKEFYSGSSTSCFPEPLDCLAELLVSLLTLENVLMNNSIKENWMFYRKAVRSMLHNPSQFDISLDNLRCLHKRLCEIENDLLSGKIFQNVLQRCMDKNLIFAIKNCCLSSEISVYVQQMLTELEKDDENISFTQILLQVNVLFVFHQHFFCLLDKKLLKRLLDVNKKAAACTLVGNIIWYPEEFLLKHIPALCKHIDKKLWIQSRHILITNRSQNLNKESQSLCVEVCILMIEMGKLAKRDQSKFKTEEIYESCDILIDGVKLVKKIRELVKWITNLYANERKPMAKSVLLTICRLIEVLKGFHFICIQNLTQLVTIILLNLQVLTHKAHQLLIQIKKNITQEKSYKDEHLDVLSSLAVAETSLKGANTTQRLLVTKLALSASGLNANTLFEIRSVMNRLDLICNIHGLLNNLCNCTFLYWHQTLLPICFGKLTEPKEDLSNYYIMLSAISDCTDIVKHSIYKETQISLNNSLIMPLNQIIETNLRLQTHLHLQLPSNNPFQNQPPENFNKIFPAQLGEYYLSIKQEVEHYLSTMFYNLTTVVLHDWRTYGEMRRLALLQYGLNTVEDNLPMQTLEQGLDVLEITRNIHIFVAKYLYNLNNQVFIEEWSNNKHLNTINISHVANSIRTHGIGIMSTTVNYTYQFLKNKFFIFSQFMFDEQIKSRLLKDLRFFTEHKNDLNQMYPYERAEKFNIGIRKLGVDSNGLSYLDLFRKLITQIGNAMGYIRLIRSGGRRCLADGTCFIRDFNAVENLNKLINESIVPELTKKAAECLTRDINNLISNFQEATEYFQLLLNVFASEFKDSKYIHLKNFYLIIPPLTINFVEHCLTCKDKLNKKNREGAAFTDDGFAIGLAYIVELLEQSTQFNSLHWFQSVKANHMKEMKKLNGQKASSVRDDEKLQQTLSLTEKRVNSFDREFHLLYYNMNSAKIFFQT